MSAAAPTTPSHRPPRVPGFVNLIGAIALLVAVMSLALVAQNASPPAVAEFAPQPQHQIQQAPQEQTSTFGNGRGGTAFYSPAPSPKASPTVPPDAIISNCIGDPPRQIEDPQSPPCVPYWAGHNGGSTSMGVSPSQVVVMSTQGSTRQSTGVDLMVSFFNKRFEFYHRQINLTESTGSNGGDAAGQRAEANFEYQTYRPFAAMNNNSGGGISYADQLARDKIIATFIRPYLPESYFKSKAPYVWAYPMAFDQLERTFANWACSRLRGKPATHAGVGSVNKPRVFGLIQTTENIDIPFSTQLFQDSLSACGIHLKDVEAPSGANYADTHAQYETSIVNLKNAGVTSVFCLCDRAIYGTFGQDADQQTYYPEWMVSSYDLFDDNAEIRTLGPPPDQRAHLFGISMFPMNRAFQDRPSTWASQSLPYNSDAVEDGRDYEYRNLLLIASGIQMAGPLLTPTTFQAGLQRAIFPNPDTPIMAGHVGFNGGSHAMTVDAAEYWWSNTERGPLPDENSGGTWCYIDHGRRHSLDDPWPAGDPGFFNVACDSGAEPAR